jgi:hypothetical protein
LSQDRLFPSSAAPQGRTALRQAQGERIRFGIS